MVRAARWRHPTLVAGVAAVLALAGCGGDRSPDTVATVSEYSLDLSGVEVTEGSVSLDVDNEGELEHELVVTQAVGDLEALPLTPTGAVDVLQVPVIDRVPAFGPGRFEVDLPTLPAGELFVFCNLITGSEGARLSHYQAGMRATLRVAEATSPDV